MRVKCLVLGGGGFQGAHLCRRLVDAGASVRVLDRVAASPIAHLVDWHTGYFADVETLKACLVGAEVVFHLISTTLPQTSNENPLADLEGNVVPTLRMLDLAREAGVRKIIFFSSGGTIYGIPEQLPISEAHPTHPICAYGIHKLAIERYLHLYQTLYGLDYAVMRIANPYGDYQAVNRGQGAVAVFLHKLRTGQPIEVWGDGSVIRDYIHIDDVMDAALRLITYTGQHKTFNIGSGRGLSLNDVIRVIANALQQQPNVVYRPGRKLDVPANVLDIRRARQELDWCPRVSFEEGIKNWVAAITQPA